MTIIGTSHFINRLAAISYYEAYEEDALQAVARKIGAGEIHIGPPQVRPGETLKVNREEGRYFIQSA